MKRFFTEALAISGLTARAAYLDRAWAGDAGRRARLEESLVAVPQTNPLDRFEAERQALNLRTPHAF